MFFFCFPPLIFGRESVVSPLHTEPPVSEMPLCDWVGHHHPGKMCRLSQCAVAKVRKLGKCCDVLYQEWAQKAALSLKMRKRWQKQWKCFTALKLKFREKKQMTQEFKIYNKSSGRRERPVFYVCVTRSGHKTFDFFFFQKQNKSCSTS